MFFYYLSTLWDCNNCSFHALAVIWKSNSQIDIDNYTFDQLQELWKPRSGEPSKIKESFEQFVIECPITGTQCDKKEIQVKVKMIGAMTDIMCKYKDEYENTFDPVESRNYENFNKYLYNAVEKYFKNVPQNDLIKYKDKRSSCLIKWYYEKNYILYYCINFCQFIFEKNNWTYPYKNQ